MWHSKEKNTIRFGIDLPPLIANCSSKYLAANLIISSGCSLRHSLARPSSKFWNPGGTLNFDGAYWTDILVYFIAMTKSHALPSLSVDAGITHYEYQAFSRGLRCTLLVLRGFLVLPTSGSTVDTALLRRHYFVAIFNVYKWTGFLANDLMITWLQ